MECFQDSVQLKVFCSPSIGTNFSRFQTNFSRFKRVRNGLHGKRLATPSDTDVCVFFVVGVACTKQMSWASVHVHVCGLYRCFWHQCTYLQTHSLQGVHMRSCMRSLFIIVGGQGWGCSASLCRALVASVEGCFDRMTYIGVLSVFCLLLTGVGMYVYVCVCVCVRTHTHTIHVRY